MNKKLHIVSFDVPYPPNYGGAIDVFNKLKALAASGVTIYFHAFEYGRGEQKELEKYCEQVFYYKRNYTQNLFASVPFTISSRSNKKLLENLKKIEAPVLFEGLHTTYWLFKEGFGDRKVLVRAHNIEHLYFQGLFNSEKNILKKLFFRIEANRFLKYEWLLEKADHILTISPSEQAYFAERFGKKAIYVPVFHQNEAVRVLSERGEYALYHGDLRISDNRRAVDFLIDVFDGLSHKLVVASSFKNKKILKRIEKHPNISFCPIEDQNQLLALFEKAHINVLPTFQKTGIKLKLINTLYNGRFCLANTEMVADTGLESICTVANTGMEFREKIRDLFKEDYSVENYQPRRAILKNFDTRKSAEQIKELI
ncbi:MAG: hypothetical protein KDC56_09030 [Flavobacteriaceae bacterium]|nr:hypothetical protein [Flavobacteriaceae bacterium]